MSSQAHDIDGGASRKRPHEMVNENGTMNSAPPAQEPRLIGDSHHLIGQFLQNMNAQQIIQGIAPFGQALAQAQVTIQNNGAPGPAAPTTQAQAPQGSVPINMMIPFQQIQAPNGSVTAAQQQAHVADLVRQLANAQANAHNIQATQVSAPAPFALPHASAPAPPQQVNQPACFPVNQMMYVNQTPVAAPFAPQQQPMTQPQQHNMTPNSQPGQLRPFGMEPQELLNYAVMVNILHNSTAQVNNNALSNLLLSQPHNSQIPQANTIQPAQQGVVQGMQGYAGFNNSVAAAPPPLPNPIIQQAAFAMNQTGGALSNEHTVSPSLPSESNYNTAGSITGQVTIPSHVIEAQKIDPQMRCVPLWTHQDQSRLSTQQCWLRKQIETFPATQRDVRRHTRGRNRILKLGQVGIQCIHCRNLPQEGRGKGSSYFLSSTKGIYQAAQNILAYHFKEDTCPIISQKLLQEMKDAGSAGCPRHLAPKAGKSRSGGGKSFWEDAAVRITGLVDTTVGIRYSDDRQNYRPLESVTVGLTENLFNGINYCSSESVLVSREDKSSVTDFCFILLSQFVPYADDSRKSNSELNEDRDSDLEDDEEARRVGIVCRFCKGVSFEGKHRDGVFLSIKPSTMMRNKQMTKLHNHLLSCRYVPEELKKTIVNAKEMHLPQSDQLKRGWKKVFFENVCLRLKSTLDAAGDSSGGEMSSLSGANEMTRL
jgi:hypothetical protein